MNILNWIFDVVFLPQFNYDKFRKAITDNEIEDVRFQLMLLRNCKLTYNYNYNYSLVRENLLEPIKKDNVEIVFEMLKFLRSYHKDTDIINNIKYIYSDLELSEILRCSAASNSINLVKILLSDDFLYKNEIEELHKDFNSNIFASPLWFSFENKNNDVTDCYLNYLYKTDNEFFVRFKEILKNGYLFDKDNEFCKEKIIEMNKIKNRNLIQNSKKIKIYQLKSYGLSKLV